MIEDASGGDGAGLSDAELITRIDALEQAKAACAAAQARLTARFVDSRSSSPATMTRPTHGRWRNIRSCRAATGVDRSPR